MAPISTIVPFSTTGRKPSCCAPVEAVDLVDEQEGADPGRLQPPGCLVERLLQIGDAREDRGELHEAQVGGLREQPGDRGLAGARAAPQDQARQAAARQHAPDRPLLTQKMILADDVLEGGGAQPVGEWPGA